MTDRGGALFTCTQNIDDLQERAGSRQVKHMHGELLKVRCTACEAVAPWREDLGTGHECPDCGQSRVLRPDVVWFGEMPMHMDAIYDALNAADLFVAIGTSGSVYPAAGFVTEARGAGVRTCEINLEPSDNAHLFDEAHYGPASDTVPKWVVCCSKDRGKPVTQRCLKHIWSDQGWAARTLIDEKRPPTRGGPSLGRKRPRWAMQRTELSHAALHNMRKIVPFGKGCPRTAHRRLAQLSACPTHSQTERSTPSR